LAYPSAVQEPWIRVDDITMKRQAAQAVTCARCAAVVTLDADHCGICWWPVSAALPVEPAEPIESDLEIVEAVESVPQTSVDPPETERALKRQVAVHEPAAEAADDYITEQIPVVLVAAGDVHGLPTQVWAPLPGTPLPGPNPFGTAFTG
jgi:hypothetical protein